MGSGSASTGGSLPAGEDLRQLSTSFEVSLRAEGKAPKTVRNYLDAVNLLGAFLESSEMPTDVRAIRRQHVAAFLADQRNRWSSATVTNRFRCLQQFFRWCMGHRDEDDERLITESPMPETAGKVTERPVDILSDEQIKALFRACKGERFVDRRDTALLWCFIDTGARLSEIANLTLDGDDGDSTIDLHKQSMRVVGKGDRVRELPLSPKTVRALDRYIRSRAKHPEAGSRWLWLGSRGHMTDSGVSQMVRRRAKQAGVGKVHPHMFRHTFAHKWLEKGGQEGDLMEIAGWRRREMLRRYGRKGASDRAKAAHKKYSPAADL